MGRAKKWINTLKGRVSNKKESGTNFVYPATSPSEAIPSSVNIRSDKAGKKTDATTSCATESQEGSYEVSNQHNTEPVKYTSATSPATDIGDDLKDSSHQQVLRPVSIRPTFDPCIEVPRGYKSGGRQRTTTDPEQKTTFNQTPVKSQEEKKEIVTDKKEELKATPPSIISSEDPESIPPGHNLKQREINQAVQLLRVNGFKISTDNAFVESPWGAAVWAVNHNKELALRYLIDRGIRFRCQLVRPLLHVAAEHGYDGILKLLLDYGHEIDCVDREHSTALMEAAKFGMGTTVRILINRGADPNKQDGNGRGPLHKAVYNGHEAVVRVLIDGRAMINARDRFMKSPLHRAVENAAKNKGVTQEKFERIVWLLVEKGASIDVVDNVGHTPFHGMGVRKRNASPNPFLDDVKLFLEDIGSERGSAATTRQHRTKELVATHRDRLKGQMDRARGEAKGQHEGKGSMSRSRYEQETGTVDPAIIRWD